MLIPVKSITIPKTIRTIDIGETILLEVAFLPINATNTNITWAIKCGADFVCFEGKNKIRAVAAGSTILRATSVENCSISAECAVKIRATEKQGGKA